MTETQAQNSFQHPNFIFILFELGLAQLSNSRVVGVLDGAEEIFGIYNIRQFLQIFHAVELLRVAEESVILLQVVSD
jgi:hypothetical protein